jgi:shikimate kinase
MRNIIITGFMGTGKTSVGRSLAGDLGIEFLDTDEIIADKAKQPIRKIFSKYGEGYFREMEKTVIREISSRGNLVIATGGGAITDDENLRNLRRNGIIICLKASVSKIKKRLGSARGRPLLHGRGASREVIEELLKKREPFYAKADVTIDTTERNISDVVREIKEILEKKNSHV